MIVLPQPLDALLISVDLSLVEQSHHTCPSSHVVIDSIKMNAIPNLLLSEIASNSNSKLVNSTTWCISYRKKRVREVIMSIRQRSAKLVLSKPPKTRYC